MHTDFKQLQIKNRKYEKKCKNLVNEVPIIAIEIRIAIN
jgi:hypothetical protein